ncbi:NADH:flavin oxidoreductase/NADH oxidase [Actinokineospora inagensis]|uniref:NADH:flavin oxidoreductase/NADH oxidase n=1 Tax=Actinokineospora inagensis TaxID=103730 RepID=UPI000411F645|nr:NADH:flavin oxidoreductase/NADH oxidase [Actinokineospora inagensis]
MSVLFSPWTVRSVTVRNRVVVSPMCQYSAVDGVPDEWHLVHLGSRAVGGAGLVLSEATAVEARGRISPGDTGIWNAEQVAAWRPVVEFIKGQGAVAGVQLAHAGRKASVYSPLVGQDGELAEADGRWTTVAPSAVRFAESYPLPQALAKAEIDELVATFAQAARNAVEAGFEVVEVHAAHGYLLHQFLSPLSNLRDDEYGGDLAGRLRFPVAVVEAVRAAVPDGVAVFVRISASDWVDGGLTVDDAVEISRAFAAAGADLIDVSTGGNVATAKIPVGPGYQVPFADAVRRKADVATGTVGLITDPRQAEAILADGSADLVLLGRELLRDPYWPLHAAAALGAEVTPPTQYARAF